MRNNRHFQRGSGCFNCNVCNRKTRNPHHSGTMLCEQCYELSGMENSIQDGIQQLGEIAAERDMLINELVAKGVSIELLMDAYGMLFEEEVKFEMQNLPIEKGGLA